MKERIAAQVFREGDKQIYLDHTFLLLNRLLLNCCYSNNSAKEYSQ